VLKTKSFIVSLKGIKPVKVKAVYGDSSMGHVKVKAVFHNGVVYARWVGGELPEGSVRRVNVEALVDTGATYPALSKDLIRRLGLVFPREVEGEVEGGAAKLRLYGLAVVQVDDRIAVCPVIERPENSTPIVGVVALEQMGFRVDPVTGKLVKGLPLMLQVA
jgi:predicted aspartyl protease